MKLRFQEKHVIDIIFVLALFAMFAFSALTLIVMGADIYKDIVNEMDQSYRSRTESAYIVEKIRSADAEGRVGICNFEGSDALVIKDEIARRSVCTYIYSYEGSLRELCTDPSYGLMPRDGNRLLSEDGEDIVMEIEIPRTGLYKIRFLYNGTLKNTIYVHLNTTGN